MNDGFDLPARPKNNLLRHLTEGDYALIASYLELSALAANEVLYNPGDDVETVYFPCEGSMACFVLDIEDGREVQVVLIGREGAVGGIVSHGRLPAFSRILVRFGGPFARLPIARLRAAKNKSATLANLFSRYADCLLAQTLQAVACNAVHSIEQRAAKWILSTMNRTQGSGAPISHEQLAGMLGVGRSYASRVIKDFKHESILQTRRLELTVLDKKALHEKSCKCDAAVASYFAEVLGGA